MSDKLIRTCEYFIAPLTIISTTIWSEFLWKLLVGVVVYFTSRLLYKNYGDKVDASLKKVAQFLKFWKR